MSPAAPFPAELVLLGCLLAGVAAWVVVEAVASIFDAYRYWRR